MRPKHVPILEGLEDRRVMSHVIPGLHNGLLLHPEVVHQVSAHPAKEVTSFGAHHGHIVHHKNLKATVAKLGLGTSNDFGGGNIDLTIPFITGTPQFPVNFTSNTYQNILYGSGGWDGIQQIVQRFDSNGGDVNQLTTDITALSLRVPFGQQMLLPIWTADLQGSLRATPSSGIVWDPGSTNANGQEVGDTLFADLNAYLGAGIGTSFNVLKSTINWSNSDNLLTYNGTVGSNDLT